MGGAGLRDGIGNGTLDVLKSLEVNVVDQLDFLELGHSSVPFCLGFADPLMSILLSSCDLFLSLLFRLRDILLLVLISHGNRLQSISPRFLDRAFALSSKLANLETDVQLVGLKLTLQISDISCSEILRFEDFLEQKGGQSLLTFDNHVGRD